MIDGMTPADPLENLESDVLRRIAAHRLAERDSNWLRLDVSMTLLALVVGVVIGHWAPRHVSSSRGSEAVVLADDARLEPSTLLAGNP
jgi:hypothetical protein